MACTTFLTFYRVCAKRGSLLANVTGIVVHDHWKPYYTMQCVLHASLAARYRTALLERGLAARYRTALLERGV